MDEAEAKQLARELTEASGWKERPSYGQMMEQNYAGDLPERGREFARELIRAHGLDKHPLKEEFEAGIGRFEAKPASAYPRRRPEFLRPDLGMPARGISVLCGQQGVGKGLVAVEIAAGLTQQGHGVIFLSDEDSYEEAIRPRLEAANADLDHVFNIVATDENDFASLVLPTHGGALKQIAVENDVRLTVLDPWTNHVEGDYDKGVIRFAMMELKRIAHDVGMAVILSAHPTKLVKDDPVTTIAHASAVTQVARAGYFVVQDPDLGEGHLLLIHVKTNPTGLKPTLRYEITPTHLEAENDMPPMTVARAVKVGECDLTWTDYRQKKAADSTDEGRPLTKTAETRLWLKDLLAEHGELRRNAIIDLGHDMGYAERTIEGVAGVRKPDGMVESFRPVGGDATTPVMWKLRAAESLRENPSAEPAEPSTRGNEVLPLDYAVPLVPLVPLSNAHKELRGTEGATASAASEPSETVGLLSEEECAEFKRSRR